MLIRMRSRTSGGDLEVAFSCGRSSLAIYAFPKQDLIRAQIPSGHEPAIQGLPVELGEAVDVGRGQPEALDGGDARRGGGSRRWMSSVHGRLPRDVHTTLQQLTQKSACRHDRGAGGREAIGLNVRQFEHRL